MDCWLFKSQVEREALAWKAFLSAHALWGPPMFTDPLLCFVVLAYHQLVLDGSINVFKLFHTLRSVVD